MNILSIFRVGQRSTSFLLLFVFFSLTSVAEINPCNDLLSYHHSSGTEFQDDILHYNEVVDFTDHTILGKTFLSVMKTTIKPALDRFATTGFIVANGEVAVVALNSKVSDKVKRQALKAVRNDENKLRTLADALSRLGPVTFYDLPAKISSIDRSVDRYELTTFFGLISGGGVALRFGEGNWAYNVNYGTGKVEKDPQTGRSFGQGPGARVADRLSTGPNDVSDKDHLDGLYDYVKTEPENARQFYRTIIETITSSDTRNVNQLSPIGQTLYSDFMAVYTAEEARRLMHPSFAKMKWDEALLEITLLSAFYARLDEVWVMYSDDFHGVPLQFTTEVYNQYPNKAGKWERRRAQFYDYWQRSSQKDPKSKDGRGTRSGINLTKRNFRVLGRAITQWQRQNNPQLVERLAELMGSRGENVYSEFSEFVIRKNAPETFGGLAHELSDAMSVFQARVVEDGPAILESLKGRNFSAK